MFHGLPHCLFQEQVPLYFPCSPSLLVPGTSNHGLPYCLFQEQVPLYFPWSPSLLVPGLSLFQEQVFLHFPCSPSLLVLGATNLLPGTSSEGEHEKSELYLFSEQIMTLPFKKQRDMFLEQVRRSKEKLFLEQVKRGKGSCSWNK